MNKHLLNPEIAIGAQPTSEDLAELKKEGFRSIFNLRRADEQSPLNPAQEAEAARSLGMEYRNIPVSPQDLTPQQADQFREELRNLPKPVFVHCQGGTRAGAFCLMHLARGAGWNAEQAFKKGEEAGYKCDSSALRQFVISYLSKPA